MKVFVWERLEHATNNYHSEGGVIVVAETVERAKELAQEQGVTFGNQYDTEVIEYELVGSHEEKVIVFPDSGCC
jgi:hypothetical protein